jgi:hypothetical protein
MGCLAQTREILEFLQDKLLMKILLCLKEYNVKNSADLEEREITECQKSFIINNVVDTIISYIQSSSLFLYTYFTLLKSYYLKRFPY